MNVSDADPRPPYKKVSDALRQAIRSGELAPGTRLPSGRELAGRFDVHVMTVQKAIGVLQDESLVRSVRGSGVYVTSEQEWTDNTEDAPPDDLPTLRADLSALQDRVAKLERLLDAAEHPSTGSPA
ncbi:winged helix-turn-helix domain-containing protein [Kribbella sp. NPDC006257]|uniref:GntR family transcriptional regulator n=1 Tax=Kribbella sp. NPDC006257 TaxID=3156738 RepID=UPI0033B87FC5